LSKDTANAIKCIRECITLEVMEPFLLSRERRASDPMMFRQCTDATEAVSKLLEQRLTGPKLQCAIIHGRWIGPLPDRFRLAAKATKFMTPENKRDHQWLAIGNLDWLLKDVNDVETLKSWYDDAVVQYMLIRISLLSCMCLTHAMVSTSVESLQ
jgi:hypothetical protein